MGNAKSDTGPGCWVFVGLSFAASGVSAWLDVNRFVGILIVLVVAAVVYGFVVASRESEPTKPQSHADADRRSTDSSGLFFGAVFQLMGHLAKADGAVTRDEIRFAVEVMDQMGLPEPAREQARSLFREGASPHFEIDQVLNRVRLGIEDQELRVALVGIAVRAAVVDGTLHTRERQLLERLCWRLGLSDAHLRALIAEARSDRYWNRGEAEAEDSHDRQGRQSHDVRSQATTVDAYRLLQVDPTCSDTELRQAYRRLMIEYHPDKLVSKGLPEDMMQYASERTALLSAAWDHLKSVRGI